MNIPELKKAHEETEEYLAYMSKEELIHPDMIKSLQTLLSACQLLCDVSDKMLPKRDKPDFKNDDSITLGFKDGYNFARSEDILWLTKKMMGLEGVIKTELDKYGLVIVAINGGEEATGDFIANAIRQEMGVGNEI